MATLNVRLLALSEGNTALGHACCTSLSLPKQGERVYAGFHIQNINADSVAVIEPSRPNA
ncbi:MAG: hypothetical protein KDJ47_05745 [Hyphomicrobiaceae bacterium]|nr:hypothetical protein [Hyphomicrobiaceae bacterium]